MEQFLVESAGAVLAVWQSRDDGEPLLLLHGGPGVPDYMQATTAPMLPRFRCISFDQRGTGQSGCRDGRYELPAYLDDIEAIRTHAGVASWHVLGHPWGGLLAQAYVSAYPHTVSSLVLVSSSLGVGGQWKRTKRESFRIEHARAGIRGTLRFYAYGSGLVIPGPVRAWSMRHVMTETWHNYFPHPGSGQVGAQAEARAVTEHQVRVGIAADIKAVRTGENGFVAVGRVNETTTLSRSPMRCPPSSHSLAAVRRKVMTGVRQRSISSTATGIKAGSARRSSCAPGQSSSAMHAPGRPLRKVSFPATANSQNMFSNSATDTWPPSLSA